MATKEVKMPKWIDTNECPACIELDAALARARGHEITSDNRMISEDEFVPIPPYSTDMATIWPVIRSVCYAPVSFGWTKTWSAYIKWGQDPASYQFAKTIPLAFARAYVIYVGDQTRIPVEGKISHALLQYIKDRYD